MEGWISLHRKFLEWEWYDDLNTKSLFIHCLLKANHTGKKWRGLDINKGSFITSRNHLSIETGLSEQQVRTALKKLESTNEITIVSTKLNTLISVCNWNKYQDSNQPDNQGATKEQPRSNQGATTTNNDNNDNKENNDNKKNRRNFIPPTTDQVSQYCLERKNNVDAQRFIDHYTSNGWMVGKNKMKDWKAAIRTWEKNNIQKQSPVKQTSFPLSDYSVNNPDDNIF